MSQLLPLSTSTTTAWRPTIEAVGRTDPGRVRPVNEDSYAVMPHVGLYMVADGMGGQACGEIASALVVEHVRKAFEDPDTTWPAGLAKPTPERGIPLLVAGIQHANHMIRDVVAKEEWRHGMGTTFAGLLVLGDRVGIAHVGDSRVWRLRHRRIDLLTEDHTLTNEYIRAGLLDPDNATTFPYRHVLSRAIDGCETLEVDTRCDAVMPGDVYVLSSDGLHEMVDCKMMAAVLLGERDLGLAAQQLVKLANDNGGTDNITVVLVRVGESPR